MGKIKVLNGGLFTTVQDRGRTGYQKFGVPVSGVMDSFSYEVGNILVGNMGGEAALETTMIGPEIEFLDDTLIAITGGDLGAEINGEGVPLWQAYPAKKGDRLSFSELKSGVRAYIAFLGGVDVPKLMGSRSTYVKGCIGGYLGRVLENGDVLEIGGLNEELEEQFLKKVPEWGVPNYTNEIEVRVVLGPQDDHFTEMGIRTFLNETYAVGMECDRMGIRLEGERIEHKRGADIVSDAVSFGSIQVPSLGKPIIMMADRQTTGGYTKIATVVSADLPKLAQIKPGDRINFKKVSLREAVDELKLAKGKLEKIKNNLEILEDYLERVKIKELLNAAFTGPIMEMRYETEDFKLNAKKKRLQNM